MDQLSPQAQAAPVQRRRPAAAELGAALRELADAAVSTEAGTDALLGVAERARALIPELNTATRTPGEPASADAVSSGPYMYNPVVGPGNPMAPPMTVEVVDGVAVGTCTLGLAYEGPARYAHGGISALLLDQILGRAHAANGRPGVTVTLSVRYRRPVPLQTPLRLKAWLDESGDHPIGRATIATAAAADTALVSAEGRFLGVKLR
ncbi:thioesterase superfamily protein [Saccharopolyspora erythraea NRRL 2338]|uniref:Acyl-coenzyme A thioesterase THEM4 n=2 Tax=Saccharopolyspora erythraea TaxID=1836 RepID=A4FI65_SACEN|nr:PaaI family thioesterase [Saccharopolyspora erythraea]EQD86211.1 thioesterase [Saccharopolyspora erythraea D]PFG97421.1 thioesterase superfamily protein [Saccharopolyspora erythraea NRRL 2338]QRK87600.1 PaaI family thioesterase [Saccharopolyspora erythraea]CAM03740.1 hypothetical protein SACE_4471 [Saccharopolyspora erythraea NRRL 2338]